MAQQQTQTDWKAYTRDCLEQRKQWLRPLQDDIEAAARACDEEEAALLHYFYATMPLRDMGAYPAALFAEYAKHAMMLRRNVEWCKALSQETFLHHVAYYRVNSENIEPCRAEFFSLLYPRVLGKSMEEAALSINEWCGKNVRYAASDMRTASPMTVYRSGIGRCGEESTFTVTALRSVGIPARQVYTPRWAHCDDNHAWVEALIDGKWRFFGACEPDMALDRGWFTAAAARGLLIHSRVFGSLPDWNDTPLAHEGLLTFYNSTQFYADTKQLSITVQQENGAPAAGAAVSLEIFNMAELVPVASLAADANGVVALSMGKGEVVAVAHAQGKFACALVCAQDETVTLVLRADSLTQALREVTQGVLDFIAPSAAPGKGAKLTAEQKARGVQRGKEIAAVREAKQGSFFDAVRAAKFPQAETLLRDARGNFDEVYGFLSAAEDANALEMRVRMLKSLSQKDLRDVHASILERHYARAMALRGAVRLGVDEAGDVLRGEAPGDIFDTCILCPRAGDEEMTDYRETLAQSFPAEKRESFLRAPKALADWIVEQITCERALDYPTVYATPCGALRMQDANRASRHILFVAACRSLGIPARLHPNTRQAEFYENGAFTPAWTEVAAAYDAALALHTDTPADFVYFTTWSIALLVQDAFVTLDYLDIHFDAQGDLTLQLQPGTYRLITSARMPNGNQKLEMELFTLQSGETASRTLRLQHGALADYCMDITLPEIALADEKGAGFLAQEKFAGQKTVLAFLEEGCEPTEHVLNELLEKCAGGGLYFAPVLVVRSLEALQNRTLARALEALPAYTLCTADFDSQLEPLARQMFADHEKLPLLVVTDSRFHGVYASSGYRVGSVDLIEKLLAAIG